MSNDNQNTELQKTLENNFKESLAVVKSYIDGKADEKQIEIDDLKARIKQLENLKGGGSGETTHNYDRIDSVVSAFSSMKNIADDVFALTDFPA